MILWRISNYASLDGIGAKLNPGRWNSFGHAVVYCADHPASALLEILVHVDVSLLPDSFQLLQISAPDDVLLATGRLPSSWTADETTTKAIGDEWLKSRSSLLLKIPSAILPDVFNILINPLHQDAGSCLVESVQHVPLDARLK
jgi:RES domain-containing protein